MAIFWWKTTTFAGFSKKPEKWWFPTQKRVLFGQISGKNDQFWAVFQNMPKIGGFPPLLAVFSKNRQKWWFSTIFPVFSKNRQNGWFSTIFPVFSKIRKNGGFPPLLTVFSKNRQNWWVSTVFVRLKPPAPPRSC